MSPSAIERRTGQGWWTIVLPRVYSTDHAEITWARAARATALWSGDQSSLSHESAGALWGLEGFPPGPLVVTTEKALRPPRDVRVHRVRELGPADVAPRGGLTVTSPARTLVDLAVVAPDRVEAALDDALRLRLVSLPKLRWYLAAHGGRGRRGTALLRKLSNERLADHVWHSGRQAWSHDLAHRNRLIALGWQVLHITHDDATLRPHEVTELVRKAVTDRTWRQELRPAKETPKRAA